MQRTREETANKYPSPVAVNCEVEELCKDEAINGYPTFMFYKNRFVEFEGAVTVSRLSKFTRKHVGGSEPDRGSDGSDTNLHLPAFGTKEESGEVLKITNDDFGKRRDPSRVCSLCSTLLGAITAWKRNQRLFWPRRAEVPAGRRFERHRFGAVDCDVEEVIPGFQY